MKRELKDYVVCPLIYVSISVSRLIPMKRELKGRCQIDGNQIMSSFKTDPDEKGTERTTTHRKPQTPTASFKTDPDEKGTESAKQLSDCPVCPSGFKTDPDEKGTESSESGDSSSTYGRFQD